MSIANHMRSVEGIPMFDSLGVHISFDIHTYHWVPPRPRPIKGKACKAFLVAALSVFQIYGDDALLHTSGTAATAATRSHQNISLFVLCFVSPLGIWDLRLQFSEVALHR